MESSLFTDPSTHPLFISNKHSSLPSAPSNFLKPIKMQLTTTLLAVFSLASSTLAWTDGVANDVQHQVKYHGRTSKTFSLPPVLFLSYSHYLSVKAHESCTWMGRAEAREVETYCAYWLNSKGTKVSEPWIQTDATGNR